MKAAKAAVNLLPPEVRPARRLPWRRLALGFAAVAAVAGLAGLGWSLHAARRAAADEVASLRREEARLEAELAAVRELPRTRASLEEKRRFVRETGETRQVWRLLQALAEAAPAGVIVSDLTLDEEDAAVVEGTAPGLAAVAAFMRHLEGTGLFRRPQVVFPAPFSEAGGRQVIPFRITATVVRGG